MKNSTKFILILAAVIVALMIVLMVMLRGIVTDHIAPPAIGEGHSFGQKQEYMGTEEWDIEDFNSIRVIGGWDLLVINDDEYRVFNGFFLKIPVAILTSGKAATLWSSVWKWKKRGKFQ